jgi:Zn-dependent peptidase ImmA (M78 family)
MGSLKSWGNIAIRNKAQLLLNEAGMKGDKDISPDKLTKHLGYEMLFFQPERDTSDIYGAVDKERKEIYINSEDPIEKQVFTIGHEIGHIRLHPDCDNVIDYRRKTESFKKLDKNQKIMEREADVFAFELLLPFKEFVASYKEYDGDTSWIANDFHIAESDIIKRVNFINKQIEDGYLPEGTAW